MSAIRPVLCLALLVLHFPFLACRSAAAPAASPASFSRTVLPNGLTVIVKPEESAGIVAIEVFIKAGASVERESTAGIGNLVAHTLLASTRNKRAETVAAVADEVGGNLQTEWHPDYTEIKAITTTSEFDRAMSLLGDILNNANFEAQWVERARLEILSGMATGGDDIFEAAYDETRQKLYRDNPYHRPPMGYARVIKSLTPDNLLQFYRKYYVPNNIVISIVGDVTEQHALDRARKAFAGTSAHEMPKQRPIPYEDIPESKAEVLERPISAAYFMFGFLAPGVASEDYPSAQVGAAALGMGKGSRMFRNLREKKGLAYDLGALYLPLANQSHIIAYLITDAYRRTFPTLSVQMLLSEVKKAMLEEVARLQNEPLSAAELERAKRYTIGAYALRHQRLRDRAYYLGWLEAIGLGAEHDIQFAAKIEAVTPTDVQRIAKKYLKNYVVTIVLPGNSEK